MESLQTGGLVGESSYQTKTTTFIIGSCQANRKENLVKLSKCSRFANKKSKHLPKVGRFCCRPFTFIHKFVESNLLSQISTIHKTYIPRIVASFFLCVLNAVFFLGHKTRTVSFKKSDPFSVLGVFFFTPLAGSNGPNGGPTNRRSGGDVCYPGFL